MPLVVQEGLETPIDNFVFRQCPAEFNLKATNSKDETPSWTENFVEQAPKAPLIQISHKNGLIFFPHHEKGALGYAPINSLAEKDNLIAEFLSFSEDKSFISALCLDPSERFIYVAKGSNKLYAVDLTAADKRPKIKKSIQSEAAVVECVASEKHELFVLLENGKILNLSTCEDEHLVEIDLDISSIVKQPISCISQVRKDLMAIGSKEKSEIYLINLEKDEISFKTISVPFEEMNGCGSIGISSIFLFEDGNNLLFSCKPENPEADDVSLLLAEKISNENEIKFSFFFDPCASRPPRQNQFYFQTLPISKWADNLVDLVVVGNFASPDLGICGRLEEGGEFQSFYIDNDEGLAQLPFVQGEVTFPLGLALDLSSNHFLENLKDPEGETHPPAPIIWVLTNTAHLCPFAMIKIDETEPFSFMKQVPSVQFSSSPSSVEEISSEELESFSSSEGEEPQTPKTPAVSASTPQTPSKVPLQQLASLQKSAEIKPVENAGTFSFKPAPSVSEPAKATSTPVVNPASTTVSSAAKPAVNTVVPEPVEPVLVKKEEKMETINVSTYQNILLAEIAATHAAMQEDLFSLKQLSLKNSLLLRQNSQKYFNSLESLETYAVTLEKLLASSDNVFLGVKERLDDLKFDLKELMGKMKQVKSTWNRIKQDNKINWDSRVKALSIASEDLFERIDRLRNFMANPIEASKYRATLKSFVDSTQEKIQLLMAHLSNLFVSQNEEISAAVFADFGGLSLSASLSSESLLDQLNVLSLETSGESISDSRAKNEQLNKSLLNAVKSRGSRLLIPKKYTPAPTAVVNQSHLKLSAEDESLISSFISAINLTEEVPEFAETAILAKLSLEDNAAKTSEAPAVKPSVFKPVAETKPFEFKAPVTESKSEPVKPFEFKPVAQTASPKPFEFKLPETKATELNEVKSSPSPANSSGLFSFSYSNSDKPQPTNVTASAFSFKPLETKETTTISPSISVNSEKSEASNASVKSEKLETSNASIKSEKIETLSESTDPQSPKETPKIPSIFTMPATEPESVLKKESPLPTFDSLNFGAEVKEEKVTETVKPFPSIFGVKTATTTEDKIDVAETVKSESNKSDTTSYFSFSSPSTSTKTNLTEEKKDEAAVPVQGFSFTFKPENAKEATKESVSEPATEPVKESEETVKESTSALAPVTTATATSATAPAFSFSFAPSVEKSPTQPTTQGFSITTKPTFGTATVPTTNTPAFGTSTSAPVFGSTSTPAAPVFGSTSLPTSASFGSVAFGQTSFPVANFNAPAPVPATPTGSSGFAAFAAASNQGATGFSAFAAPQSGNGNGLTFASFLPADKDKKEKEQQQGGAPSSFSFTGFRE